MTSYPPSAASRITRAVTLAVVVALSACASRPIVQWQAPTKTGGEKAQQTLDSAYSYADAARAAYQNAVVSQLKESSDLSTALVATGALTAALAISSGVHRDVFTGATLLGGTAYAVGNMSLSRPRLLVYQAGVEAINCAKRAVAPLNFEIEDQNALIKALSDLAQQRQSTEAAQRQVDKALAPLVERGQGGTVIAVAAQASLANSIGVQKQAGDAATTGTGLLAATRRASAELVLAVDRIDASVVRGSLDTVPDLSAVPRIIAGLAGIYDQFAPNAGVGKRVTDGLTTMGKSFSGSGSDPKVSLDAEQIKLVAATNALDAATVTLSERLIDVNVRVAGRATTWSADAFKDCGVADMVQPLKTQPSALEFVAGSEATSRVILISGGVKPYLVELDGPAVTGLTIRQPVPFESRAEVFFTKELAAQPQPLVLRVTDASGLARLQTVAINVTPAKVAPQPVAGASKAQSAASAPTASKTTPSPASAETKAISVVQALTKHAAKLLPDLPAGLLIRTPPTSTGSTVTVVMGCDASVAEADRPTKEAVIAALRKVASPTASDGVTFALSAKNPDGSSCLR